MQGDKGEDRKTSDKPTTKTKLPMKKRKKTNSHE